MEKLRKLEDDKNQFLRKVFKKQMKENQKNGEEIQQNIALEYVIEAEKVQAIWKIASLSSTFRRPMKKEAF